MESKGVSIFETGFVAEFDQTEDLGSVQDGLVQCIFYADDAEIKVSVNSEEHPEMKRLISGKLYRVTIESCDE